MNTIIAFVVVLFAISKTTQGEELYNNKLSSLRVHLLQDYDPKTIPLVEVNHPVRVNVDLMFNNILDVDEDAGIIEFYGWVRADWKDPRLTFDNEAYGANETRVEVDKLWLPDLSVYNSVEQDLLVLKDSKVDAIVFNTGDVMVVTPFKFKTSCQFNKTHNGEPHHCFVKMGSWTHSIRDIDIHVKSQLDRVNNVMPTSGKVDLSHYNPHRKWVIEALPTVRDEITYPCCPEVYPSVSFHFQLKHADASEAGRQADNDKRK